LATLTLPTITIILIFNPIQRRINIENTLAAMWFLDMFRTKTLAEQLRDNKRHIDRAVRDLDRERQRLEQQEKKTLAEMKKMARLGQQVFAA
jgi:hypothetical protein